MGESPHCFGLCLCTRSNLPSRPRGGSYTLPAPISGTDTNAGGQQRGAQGSGTNPDGPDGSEGPTANSTASGPTQAGIANTCNAFAYANTDDTCYSLSQAFHVTLGQLTTWNPVLGYPDGHNCTAQFWAGYDYCVGVPGSSISSPSTSTESSATTSSLLYPTQSGISSACDKYAEAKPGDYCYIFAQINNITTDQLYTWNAVLGPNGANCSTKFQAGYQYCVSATSNTRGLQWTNPDIYKVGVSTPSAKTTDTAVPATSTTTSSTIPTQSGFASNCNKTFVAQKGDTCFSLAQSNGKSPSREACSSSRRTVVNVEIC